MKHRYEVRTLEEWEQKLYEELLLVQMDHQHWFIVMLHPDFPEEFIIPIQ